MARWLDWQSSTTLEVGPGWFFFSPLESWLGPCPVLPYRDKRRTSALEGQDGGQEGGATVLRYTVRCLRQVVQSMCAYFVPVLPSGWPLCQCSCAVHVHVLLLRCTCGTDRTPLSLPFPSVSFLPCFLVPPLSLYGPRCSGPK